MTLDSPRPAGPPALGGFTPGQSVTFAQTITEQMVDAYAAFSGDFNPIHMDEAYARRAGFRGRVAHGMIACACLSQLIGMRLPGPGALWTSQSFRWLAPVFIGDRIEFTVRVTAVSPGAGTVALSAKVLNQNGRTVMEGDGLVQLLDPRTPHTGPGAARRALVLSGGAAIPQALAALGLDVALLSTAPETRQTCDSIRAAGVRALALEADPLDPASLPPALAACEDAFGGPIDVLVHDPALQAAPQPIQDIPWSTLRRQLDAELQAAFHLVQAVLPGMLRAGSGRIIHIGSTLAWNAPPPHWTVYSTAKAALKAFTHSLAVELGPKGIRVNLVSPGLPAEGSEELIPERQRKLQAVQTPLRRLSTQADVAAAVAFLCGQPAEFITGADIPVCGGAAM